MSEPTQYTFRIEVYTDGLLISGSYDLPLYRRVSDALNSRLHRYITLRDATIAPQNRPQQVQRVPQLLVDWGGALLVTTLEEPLPPPDHQIASPLVRDTQPMMFFTSTFALRANVYKRPGLEMIEVLEQLTDDFIPLSDVQLFPLSGGQALTRQFACLNRNHIQALYPLVLPTAATVPPATPAGPEIAADNGVPANADSVPDTGSE